MNSPNDMPLKATCARASPNSECRLSTKKRPTIEQITDIAIADIRALCIKPYWIKSNTISINFIFRIVSSIFFVTKVKIHM